jgi:hypothetical protein
MSSRTFRCGMDVFVSGHRKSSGPVQHDPEGRLASLVSDIFKQKDPKLDAMGCGSVFVQSVSLIWPI